MKNNSKEIKKCPVPLWKRVGYLGFWFFFFKGILWLLGLAAVYFWGPDFLSNSTEFILNILN